MNLSLLKRTWDAFNEDKVPRLAAAIAYSTIFSLAPLLIVLIAVLGWFLSVPNGGHGHQVAENALLDEVRRNAGTGTAETVRRLVTAVFSHPREGVVAQIVGWGSFLVGATAFFSALQDALNAIWQIESTKGGWKQMARGRLASFGMILIVGLLLLVTLVANAGMTFVGAHLLSRMALATSPAVLAIAEQLITFAVATVAFALIYKVLPDVKVAWRDVWIGAAVTAVLFMVGEAAISFYLAFVGVASAYGAAGAPLAALLWIYYSAMVLLLGAEFAKVSAVHAETVVSCSVRELSDRPVGVDPRSSRRPSHHRGDVIEKQ
jgi:membrane protein